MIEVNESNIVSNIKLVFDNSVLMFIIKIALSASRFHQYIYIYIKG